MVSSIACWVSLVIVLHGHGISAKASGRHHCKCVPDQWEGILSSVEREFDMKEAKTDMLENNIYVHYDYTNQRFVMNDLSSGKKAMVDYRAGQKYIVTEFGCYKMPTTEEMRKMCLPDEAEFLGDYTLGTEVRVGIWQITSSFNLTTRTTVIESNCIPVSEEIYLAKGAFASLTSSLYLDVSLGITDAGVFNAPANCVQVPDVEEEGNYIEVEKKKREFSFSEMIRNHFPKH